MQVYFPLSSDERDALLRGSYDDFPELAGLDRIEWGNSGALSDAVWLVAELPDDVAARYEEPDSEFLGYRSLVLPQAVLRTLTYTTVSDEEVAAAASRDPEWKYR